MSDLVVINGDMLKFEINFGSKTVTPVGVCKITGSGNVSINNQPVCIVGDEKKVIIQATYITADFPVLGTGNITITGLKKDQQAAFVKADTAVIVKGAKFEAGFQPLAPATHPTNGPDTDLNQAKGSGEFITSQNFVTAG